MRAKWLSAATTNRKEPMMDIRGGIGERRVETGSVQLGSQAVWQGVDNRFCPGQLDGVLYCHARFHLIDITHPHILLNCGVEFRETLENGGDVVMIVHGVVSSNVSAVHQKLAAVEI